MNGCAWVVLASLLAYAPRGLDFAAGRGNPLCWSSGYSYEDCCPPDAPEGNPKCWESAGPPFSYGYCCSSQPSCDSVFTRAEWEEVLGAADLDGGAPSAESLAKRREFIIELYSRMSDGPNYGIIGRNCPEGMIALLFHSARAFYHTGRLREANSVIRGVYAMAENDQGIRLPLKMLANILHAYTVDFPETRRDLVVPHAGRLPRHVLEHLLAREFAFVRPEFAKRVLAHHHEVVSERGDHIQPSEALAVAAFCNIFGATVLLESGVSEGWSTAIWARWVANVTAIDQQLWSTTRENLLPFGERVRLLEGDGDQLLPNEARSLEVDAAVVIDGPKREAALRLARKVFDASDHVKFVAVHDMRHFKHTAVFRDHGLEPIFFTNDPWFVRAHGALDDACVTAECRYRHSSRMAFSDRGSGGVFVVLVRANASEADLTALAEVSMDSVVEETYARSPPVREASVASPDHWGRQMVVLRLHKSGRVKELQALCSTAVGEIVRRYAARSWELRRLGGPSLLESLTMADLAPETCRPDGRHYGEPALLEFELVEDSF